MSDFGPKSDFVPEFPSRTPRRVQNLLGFKVQSICLGPKRGNNIKEGILLGVGFVVSCLILELRMNSFRRIYLGSS